MTCLAEESIVEEAKPFVDVGQDPGIGVDVEAVNHLKITIVKLRPQPQSYFN
jgi:hypothetical protein